ncbi:MAG TPA: hypothetical protein VMV36_01915 [Ignavibacteriaceae bacterium]|nr:hypothetical protein [Ignavibacteriaceae bacterium]
MSILHNFYLGFKNSYPHYIRNLEGGVFVLSLTFAKDHICPK